jgi:PilZ domain
VNSRGERNPPQAQDKRSEARYAASANAGIDVLGEQPYSFDAIVVDVSSRGMRLATNQPLATDAALRIRLGLDHYLGEVTHCSPDANFTPGDRYFVGIGLINVMRNAAVVSERYNRTLLPR